MPPTFLDVFPSGTDGVSLPAELLYPVVWNATKNPYIPICILRDVFGGLPVVEGEQCRHLKQVINHCKMWP